MKRKASTDEEDTLKKRQAEIDYPKWTRQSWEDDLPIYSFEEHFVSLAVKHGQGDGCNLEDHAKHGQILGASSGFAEIFLIHAKSYCDSSSSKNDAIGIYFDTPLKIDVKHVSDIYFRLTIDGQEIEVRSDRDMRLNKLKGVNKPSNMTTSYRCGKGGKHGTYTWTIKAIEIVCHDSYTSELYAALMHQYISKNKDKVGTHRK